MGGRQNIRIHPPIDHNKLLVSTRFRRSSKSNSMEGLRHTCTCSAIWPMEPNDASKISEMFYHYYDCTCNLHDGLTLFGATDMSGFNITGVFCLKGCSI